MKNRTKKLTLTTQSLRVLDGAALRSAGGGAEQDQFTFDKQTDRYEALPGYYTQRKTDNGSH